MRDGRTVAELSGEGLGEKGVLAVMAHGADGANGGVADV